MNTNQNVFRDMEQVDNLAHYDVLDEQFNELRMPIIYLRIMDPFSFYDDEEFKKRYRFSKHSVQNIIMPLLCDALQLNNMRGLPISLELQVLIALRFYATGSFQVVCGDLHFISQPTVSRIIKNVSAKLAGLADQYVKFPEELQSVYDGFSNIQSRYPGLNHIRGAIDCTHIKIKRPRGIQHSEAYRNRKGYFSINAQFVVGPDMKVYDVVARWPGSSHDSRIFRNSRLHALLESGQLQGTLVGDSGYRAATYMLTPFINPTTPSQIRYNYVQVRTRNIVERFFGVWKKCFPCLQVGLATKLTTATNIIVACAVLHNIRMNCEEFPVQDLEEIRDSEEGDSSSVRANPASGVAYRNAIVEQYYSY